MINKYFLVLVVLLASRTTILGQMNIDKNEFRNSFLKVFQARANKFDSIVVKEDDDSELHFETTVKLPGAAKCFIGEGYNAMYLFSSVDQCSKTYTKLKEYLSDVAKVYKSIARFVMLENKPDRNAVYFTDSLGFIAAPIYLLSAKEYTDIPEYSEGFGDDMEELMAPPGKPKIIRIIDVHVQGDAMYAQFVSKGEKATDTALARFIKEVAFSPDVTMKNLRGKFIKRDNMTDAYESKKTLPGFTAMVTESSYSDSKTIDHSLRLYKEYSLNEKDFLKTVETFLVQVKSALPDSYCYVVDPETHVISFYKHPFQAGYDKPHTTIDIEYGPTTDKKGSYSMAMFITRNSM